MNFDVSMGALGVGCGHDVVQQLVLPRVPPAVGPPCMAGADFVLFALSSLAGRLLEACLGLLQ